jgi:hypothetical protein
MMGMTESSKQEHRRQGPQSELTDPPQSSTYQILQSIKWPYKGRAYASSCLVFETTQKVSILLGPGD